MAEDWPWAPQVEQALSDAGYNGAVQAVKPLVGGACQDNLAVDLDGASGPLRVALRVDAAASLPGSLGRADEHQVIRAAVASGVPTARPIAWLPGLFGEGRDAVLLEWVEGTAIGAKVTRDPALADARRGLVDAVADAMAAAHRVRRDEHPELALTMPHSAHDCGPVEAALRFSRQMLDRAPVSRFDLEAVLAWLVANRPDEQDPVLVHGDLRTGNIMVAPAGFTALLDWEFAHWGAPEEDIAWICLRDWRFGKLDLACGGFATRAAWYAAVQQATGRAVDAEGVRWWEVLGNLRWATGALYQAQRVLSGASRDLELLAIGRRADEMAFEALRLIAASPSEVPRATSP